MSGRTCSWPHWPSALYEGDMLKLHWLPLMLKPMSEIENQLKMLWVSINPFKNQNGGTLSKFDNLSCKGSYDPIFKLGLPLHRISKENCIIKKKYLRADDTSERRHHGLKCAVTGTAAD